MRAIVQLWNQIGSQRVVPLDSAACLRKLREVASKGAEAANVIERQLHGHPGTRPVDQSLDESAGNLSFVKYVGF